MEDNKTKFKGGVSLDAIFASTSKNKVDSKTTETIKEPIKEEVKTPEPEVEKEESFDKPDVTEIKDEEKQPEPKKQVEARPQEATETEAFKRAKFLLDNGVIEDFSIQTSDEDEDGTLISEYSQMSDEDLKEIIAIQKQEKDKEISSKYISKDGLKEHQLKVIDILKNGGDLSKIAETPDKALLRPFEGFDMESQERQIDVLYTDLVSGKGLKHEKAIELIKLSVQNKTIEEEANEIFDTYRNAHSNYLDQVAKEQKKEKEFKDTNFKANRKMLADKMKEGGLKEGVYKKVVAEYSKKNENGEYLLVEKMREALEKPEENYELILHLADKEAFNGFEKLRASQDMHKKIVRLNNQAQTKSNQRTVKSNATTDTPLWMKHAQQFNQNIKTKN